MSGMEATVYMERPGSPSGIARPTSPCSARLIHGIRKDDLVFDSQNCHLALLDHGIHNVDVLVRDDPYYEKYRKLLAKDKLMFQALFRKAILRAGEFDLGSLPMPLPNMVKPQVQAYATFPAIAPTDRELHKVRLDRLLVVKIVKFTKKSLEAELFSVISQLKVLNEMYSSSIPLLLVSNYFNNNFVEKVAQKHRDKNLIIHIVKQPLFPLIHRIRHGPSDDNSAPESNAPQCGTFQSSVLQPKAFHFGVSRKEKEEIEENEDKEETEPSLPDWYNPGEIYTLYEQVISHSSAEEKDYFLLLNSKNLENIVDLKILNFLCEQRTGPRIEVCFEVLKPRQSHLNDRSDFLVMSEGKLSVHPHSSLVRSGYDVSTDDFMITKNMWINTDFLRKKESEAILMELVFSKEFKVAAKKTEIRLQMTVGSLIESQGAVCAAVDVPETRIIAGGWLHKRLNPTCVAKFKLKACSTFILFSVLYHGIIYLMTAFLHEKYLKKDDLKCERDEGREQRELNLFWIENSVWFLLVVLYFWFLTSRRLKIAGRSRSTRERKNRARGDFAQAVLLGSTRFLYAGFNKTAEVNNWFGGNSFKYLLVLHGIAALLEFLGSVLIMFFYDGRNVMEPLETA